MDIREYVDRIEPEIYEIYKQIHQNPELSFQERQTSALVEKELREKTSVDRLIRVGDTGWLAEIKGTGTGPAKVIALRGDMDALPIQESEETPGEVHSKVPGVMHACGHDVHTSILLGAVRTLEHYRDQISGSVLFFFQPAEEVLGGARQFLASPDIDFSKIDGVAACHVSPEIDAGTIGISHGAILASADTIKLRVTGMGGHGAHPHTVIDPVTISAQIITALQTLVSRETPSNNAAVLSICTIHGGKVHNIVPESVEMTGTLRTLNPDDRQLLLKRIPELCENIAKAMRGVANVELELGPPPFISENEWVDRVVRCGTKLLGPENVIEMEAPSMGAEDFAFIKEKCPGVFVRLGARTPGGPYGSMHSPGFYTDRSSLAAGILTLAGIALDFFEADY